MDEDARHQASVQLRRDLHCIALRTARRTWGCPDCDGGWCIGCWRVAGEGWVRSTPVDPAG
jgi:hypothetical protein